MGKQTTPAPRKAALRKRMRHFDDAGWSLAMAAAWITQPSEANVEAAARGFGLVDAATIDQLLKHLSSGQLPAARLVSHGEVRDIDPRTWAALDIHVARKPFPGAGRSFLGSRDKRERGAPSATGRTTAVRSIARQGNKHLPVDNVVVSRADVMRLYPDPTKAKPDVGPIARARILDDLIGQMTESPQRPESMSLKRIFETLFKPKYPRLSRREFERLVAEAARKVPRSEWRRPGRPRKNQRG